MQANISGGSLELSELQDKLEKEPAFNLTVTCRDWNNTGEFLFRLNWYAGCTVRAAQFVLHWVYRWEGAGDAVRPAWDLTVTPATGLHPNHLTELELLGGMEVFYN